MTYLMACLLGAFIGYGLASIRAPQMDAARVKRRLEGNVVPLTAYDRARLRELHLIDQEEARS